MPTAQPSRKRKYDEQVRQALTQLWHVANGICSKRLVPFLPELIKSMERHGHLALPEKVRSKLLTISPATMDRLLKQERAKARNAGHRQPFVPRLWTPFQKHSARPTPQ